MAAGGIGSPLILRHSGIHAAGYDFFFDPLITVCGTMKDVSSRHNEIPMSAGVHMKDEGYLMTDMAIPPSEHSFSLPRYSASPSCSPSAAPPGSW